MKPKKRPLKNSYKKNQKPHIFPNAREDVENVSYFDDSEQTCSPSYRLAYDDLDFIMRDELRPVRLQLELLKPEIAFKENNIYTSIVVFGGSRFIEREKAEKKLADLKSAAQSQPDNAHLKEQLSIAERQLENAGYYSAARELAQLITEKTKSDEHPPVIVTGGGPGIMEAANRGAHDQNCKSIGLNIVLPTEQHPNPYITPELCFQFHYFAIRKMHFLMRAKALIVFPGGFGTMDELFETLTLIQTKKIKPLPVILFGPGYWKKIINFDALHEQGAISQDDLKLISFVESVEQAWHILRDHL